ncbi:hypothetical protein B0T18DRAFT_416017 [Schizothecium vesticola]|uniref:DM13 domain-containing protein n=1 Tax=Schizothecium vesticola TaxID=314040 RepID=A0AA40EQU6_9PEZI|nr:hypothetical protein B0T18DRAFT_416017 [Schizothecium vesticola]
MRNIISTILILTSVFFRAAYSQSAIAANKTGWRGTLSSLDGGLGGTIIVADEDTLVINSYALEDGLAPALYWWGSASPRLSEGFRISNKQVNEAATSDTYTIALDAGRALEDFTTVGLWCEKFSVNFGQATLAPPTSGGSDTVGAAPSGGGKVMGNAGAVNGVWRVAVGVPVLLVTYFLM